MKKSKSQIIYGLLVFILIYYSNLYAANNVNIKVVFPFTVSNVAIHGWGTNLNLNSNMSQTGRNEFSITIPTDIQDMIFYIDYNAPQYTENGKMYIAGGNVYSKKDYEDKIPYRFDAKGILYGKIYINNQLIDNSYTVLNTDKSGLNISIKLN